MKRVTGLGIEKHPKDKEGFLVKRANSFTALSAPHKPADKEIPVVMPFQCPADWSAETREALLRYLQAPQRSCWLACNRGREKQCARRHLEARHCKNTIYSSKKEVKTFPSPNSPRIGA